MIHPAETPAEQRLMTLVDDVGDMARVLSNGPEPHYAEEKLGFALEQRARALAIVGWSGDVIAVQAAKAAQREVRIARGREEDGS
jgi:hypothetical protein